jgi:DUF4097 and DUF4098 domain-containing protein YvlB
MQGSTFGNLLLIIKKVIMSKVYLEQVQKAQKLAAGLKKNYDLVKGRGISREQISQMEEFAGEAFKMNQEIEELRTKISVKVVEANRKLNEIKINVHSAKQVIKQHFDQTKWVDFGILDKR